MTDTFLDDHATINLLRDLKGIARNLPEVVRIARRETSPPGGKFARNPNVPNSRPVSYTHLTLPTIYSV